MCILFYSSNARHWILLLITLILNIFLIFQPQNGTICPTVYSFSNGTLPEEYIIATFTLDALYTLLAAWLVLEHFTITWPHFVLPKFIYKLCCKLGRYRLTAWMSK